MKKQTALVTGATGATAAAEAVAIAEEVPDRGAEAAVEYASLITRVLFNNARR